jgi:hypothetical protein
MASSDYTNSMKMKNMYIRQPCNLINFDCNDISRRVVYNIENNRYNTISKTIKKYYITPIKNGSVIFTIEAHLKNFLVNQAVSVYSDVNYFEGDIVNYDQISGEIIINNIDNLTGNFNDNLFYSVCLLGFNPDVIKLNKRMKDLYQYLFQVDIDIFPDYNPNIELYILYRLQIARLYKYLFNINLEEDPDYSIEYSYLENKINYLYFYFFDLDIKNNQDFNPNNNGIKLNTLKNSINQLYVYLFNINLNNDPKFNINTNS